MATDAFDCPGAKTLMGDFFADELGGRPDLALFLTGFNCRPGSERGQNGRAQAVKKPTESSRGPKPSRILIAPGGVYGGCGAILSQGNPISRRENSCFAEFYSFLIP